MSVKKDQPTWEDRYPDQVTCVRCLIVKERADLDRLLWCDECRLLASERALDVAWWVGGAVAAVLAVYIWLVVEPSRPLMGAWIGLTLAAFYLAARLTKNILYGLQRLRNQRATEAVPPGADASFDAGPDATGPDTPESGPPEGRPGSEDDGPPQVNLRR